MIMPVSGNLMNISYALYRGLWRTAVCPQGFDLGGLVVYLNYSKQVGQPPEPDLPADDHPALRPGRS